MPPVEQPARTTATARSAAARARLGTGRCDRDVNIMPVQAPRRIATPPRRPASPLRGKIAANSSNAKHAVVRQYRSSVKINGPVADRGPKTAQTMTDNALHDPTDD